MKEITDILKAYSKAEQENKRSALATVVKVEGSSYRRPGARMLVTEDGLLTGAISGGCLEGDALKKALSAIHQQQKKLVTYDTTDEDDAKFGVQLGCNGIVHILFEPINSKETNNPIDILKALVAERESAVLITLFATEHQQQLGSIMLYRKAKISSIVPDQISKEISEKAQQILLGQTSHFGALEINGLSYEAFFEYTSPPISLIIAGAGNDVQPLVQMAYLLGWEVTVVDGRPTHATTQRFPNANRVLIAKPNDLMNKVEIDGQTAFALMTHNYNYDTELLNLLLHTNAPYIGTLGPKKKLVRMLDELNLNTEENQHRVHGPIGLDIGAETAEEIAISIIAEIKAFFAGAGATSLKNKKNSIHTHEIN
ncbi:XdhC family protein [Pedobacter frigiditerrae]|uniref:XdhC family protein n=1 Tax=Pedobacter frigiditerrae TaxID=2530452 RepID=UPI00292E3754|nr:XdhC family protein [Pedobacter frigiditerrae]